MGRRKYKLKADDLSYTRKWIARQMYTTPDCQDSQSLNSWCEEHLSTDQWSRLKACLRSRRRAPRDGVRLGISRAAHEALKEQATRYGITLSETIELACAELARKPTALAMPTNMAEFQALVERLRAEHPGWNKHGNVIVNCHKILKVEGVIDINQVEFRVLVDGLK